MTPLPFQTARAAWGVACLTCPKRMAALAVQGRPDHRTTAVVRVLGVRHLAQVALTSAFPVRRVWLAGAVVDGLHAASMLGLAAFDSQRRRTAMIDAAVATGWGVLSAVVGIVATRK